MGSRASERILERGDKAMIEVEMKEAEDKSTSRGGGGGG